MVVVDAEVKRMDEKREEAARISPLWFWLMPLLMGVGFSIVMVAFKFILEEFIGWWNIVGICALVFALGQGAGWLIYYFKKSKGVEVKEKIPELTHRECHEFIVSWARRHEPYANLRNYEGENKIAGVRSCGSPSTQVYVEKFRNANLEVAETYYFFMRINDPDTSINYRSFTQPLLKEAEELMVQRECENLAISPRIYTEKRLERSSAVTGVTEIETSREPTNTSLKLDKPEDGKEDIEG
jgi:hypothetical protein